MTKPAPTYCQFEDHKYEAVGFRYPHWIPDRDPNETDRLGFIIPPDVGVPKITRCSTACWHGYRYGLAVRDNQLIITTLVIMLGEDEKPWPTIHGVEGSIRDDYDWYANGDSPIWTGLSIPTTFTGILPLVGPYSEEDHPYVEDEPVAPWNWHGNPYRQDIWPEHLQLELTTPDDAVDTSEVSEGLHKHFGLDPLPPQIRTIRRTSTAHWLHRYRGLLELHVEEGRVTHTTNRSEELRQIRMGVGDHMRSLRDKAVEMIKAGDTPEAIEMATGITEEKLEHLHR
jgi:hypothetical protein